MLSCPSPARAVMCVSLFFSFLFFFCFLFFEGDIKRACLLLSFFFFWCCCCFAYACVSLCDAVCVLRVPELCDGGVVSEDAYTQTHTHRSTFE